MSLFTNHPPPSRTPYAIPQLEGERITIPGSKGTFRILASSKQTNGLMAVFQSGGVLSDAPGFHYHNQAHDVFLVTKGSLKLWNGDKCRLLGPGDFAYVPPKIIHNPEMLGPHTEIYGLITPGDWVDFFRYISEPYEGILVPESDNRDLKSLLIPKVIAAKGKFDVIFQPNHIPAELGEWDSDDERLPDAQAPFFLKANTGPRWMLGGVMSRPFVTTKQSAGVCAISSIESSSVYGGESSILSKFMTFEVVDHCLCVLEGTLGVRLQGEEAEAEFREGETVVIPAGRAFALQFRSRYVRVWSFTDGDGIETLVHRAGEAYEGVVLPEEVGGWDSARVKSVAEELKVDIEM
ncbi:RmlC-like cupin domain-containing protein [Aspergillus cavernicola]|uniref:RmlC-like cupin domain-containing protein n=1 Tax=Aspergillus cavernicola TaxID=176166 RepID=A0ABR4HSD2_9EURO